MRLSSLGNSRDKHKGNGGFSLFSYLRVLFWVRSFAFSNLVLCVASSCEQEAHTFISLFSRSVCSLSAKTAHNLFMCLCTACFCTILGVFSSKTSQTSPTVHCRSGLTLTCCTFFVGMCVVYVMHVWVLVWRFFVFTLQG